jgi:hypothetical protein
MRALSARFVLELARLRARKGAVWGVTPCASAHLAAQYAVVTVADQLLQEVPFRSGRSVVWHLIAALAADEAQRCPRSGGRSRPGRRGGLSGLAPRPSECRAKHRRASGSLGRVAQAALTPTGVGCPICPGALEAVGQKPPHMLRTPGRKMGPRGSHPSRKCSPCSTIRSTCCAGCARRSGKAPFATEHSLS